VSSDTIHIIIHVKGGKVVDKKALHKLTYGLFVISSIKDGKPNGQIANVAFQVTSKPVKIAIALHKDNLTCEYVKTSHIFSVSILDQTADMIFIGRFGFRSGRNFNKFDSSIHWKTGITGAPIVLDHTIAYLEAEVEKEIDLGSHIMFIGQVVDGQVVKDGIPLTYDYYHNVIKGKEPERAPTYNE